MLRRKKFLIHIIIIEEINEADFCSGVGVKDGCFREQGAAVGTEGGSLCHRCFIHKFWGFKVLRLKAYESIKGFLIFETDGTCNERRSSEK